MENFVTEYLMPIFENGLIIIIGGFIVGEIIKKWVPDEVLENKLIPTVNTVLGALAGMFVTSIFPTAPNHMTAAIWGALCGYLASPIYDKVIAPIISSFTNK